MGLGVSRSQTNSSVKPFPMFRTLPASGFVGAVRSSISWMNADSVRAKPTLTIRFCSPVLSAYLGGSLADPRSVGVTNGYRRWQRLGTGRISKNMFLAKCCSTWRTRRPIFSHWIKFFVFRVDNISLIPQPDSGNLIFFSRNTRRLTWTLVGFWSHVVMFHCSILYQRAS